MDTKKHGRMNKEGTTLKSEAEKYLIEVGINDEMIYEVHHI